MNVNAVKKKKSVTLAHTLLTRLSPSSLRRLSSSASLRLLPANLLQKEAVEKESGSHCLAVRTEHRSQLPVGVPAAGVVAMETL